MHGCGSDSPVGHEAYRVVPRDFCGRAWKSVLVGAEGEILVAILRVGGVIENHAGELREQRGHGEVPDRHPCITDGGHEHAWRIPLPAIHTWPCLKMHGHFLDGLGQKLFQLDSILFGERGGEIRLSTLFSTEVSEDDRSRVLRGGGSETARR